MFPSDKVAITISSDVAIWLGSLHYIWVSAERLETSEPAQDSSAFAKYMSAPCGAVVLCVEASLPPAQSQLPPLSGSSEELLQHAGEDRTEG